MLPATIDFPCRRNADYGEELAFTDGQIPVDLTGIVFRMDVRLYPTGPIAFSVLQINNPNFVGFFIDDPATGVVRLLISRSILRNAYDNFVSNQQIGEYLQFSHDISAKYPDGKVEIFAQGVLTVQPGVTINV